MSKKFSISLILGFIFGNLIQQFVIRGLEEDLKRIDEELEFLRDSKRHWFEECMKLRKLRWNDRVRKKYKSYNS